LLPRALAWRIESGLLWSKELCDLMWLPITSLFFLILLFLHFSLFIFIDLIFAGVHDPEVVDTGTGVANADKVIWLQPASMHNVRVLTFRRKFIAWLITDENNDWQVLCKMYNTSIQEIGLNGLIDATMGRLDTTTWFQRLRHTTLLPHVPLLPLRMVTTYVKYDRFLQTFYLKHMAAIHILGRWIMERCHREVSIACDPGGEQSIIAVAAWSQKYVLAQGGAPMHGAVWHAMLEATTSKSEAFEYWAVSDRLCNFTNSFVAVSWSCFHGSGHAMLLSGMENDARRTPCVSPSRVMYPLNARDLKRGASLCAAGRSAQHAFLCADGLFDQYFQLSALPPEDDLWPGVCTRLSPFSGPCFNNYLAGAKLYWPNNKMRHGYLAFEIVTPDCAKVKGTEAQHRGCIFGLTRNQFTFWRWYQHFETSKASLVQWCEVVVDSVHLEPDIRYGRWLTCIAASMFGFNFGLGLSNASNHIVEEMCAGLGHVLDFQSNAAVSSCLSIGLAAVAPSTVDAVRVLPSWLAH